MNEPLSRQGRAEGRLAQDPTTYQSEGEPGQSVENLEPQGQQGDKARNHEEQEEPIQGPGLGGAESQQAPDERRAHQDPGHGMEDGTD